MVAACIGSAHIAAAYPPLSTRLSAGAVGDRRTVCDIITQQTVRREAVTMALRARRHIGCVAYLRRLFCC
jgi:hypothetical protein